VLHRGDTQLRRRDELLRRHRVLEQHHVRQQYLLRQSERRLHRFIAMLRGADLLLSGRRPPQHLSAGRFAARVLKC
jgi:hypothetical protein